MLNEIIELEYVNYQVKETINNKAEYIKLYYKLMERVSLTQNLVDTLKLKADKGLITLIEQYKYCQLVVWRTKLECKVLKLYAQTLALYLKTNEIVYKNTIAEFFNTSYLSSKEKAELYITLVKFNQLTHLINLICNEEHEKVYNANYYLDIEQLFDTIECLFSGYS